MWHNKKRPHQTELKAGYCNDCAWLRCSPATRLTYHILHKTRDPLSASAFGIGRLNGRAITAQKRNQTDHCVGYFSRWHTWDEEVLIARLLLGEHIHTDHLRSYLSRRRMLHVKAVCYRGTVKRFQIRKLSFRKNSQIVFFFSIKVLHRASSEPFQKKISRSKIVFKSVSIRHGLRNCPVVANKKLGTWSPAYSTWQRACQRQAPRPSLFPLRR